MSYQFIHVEAYGLNVSKKGKKIGSKTASESSGFNNETRGRSVREIVAEATREAGFCDHVEHPELSSQNKILFGCSVQEVEILAQNYFENTTQKQELKSGKIVEKGLRKDANVLLAGVVSVNSANAEIWDEYKKEALEFLKKKYGNKLKCVIEHKDENHPHFHFYAIEDPGNKFELHDGKKAISDNKDLKLIDRNNEYKKAMEKFQEDFFLNVSKNFGLTKDGPRRARLSNSDYRKLSNEVQLIANAKKKNEKEILNSQAKLEVEKEKEIKKVSIETKKKIVDEFESKKSFLGFGQKKFVTNAKIELLKNQIQEKNEKMKIFSNNNKGYKLKIKKMEQAEIDRVQDQIETSKKINAKLERADYIIKDYNNLKNENSILKTDKNNLTSENSDLKFKNDNLRTENSVLKDAVSKLQTIFEIDDLKEFFKKKFTKPSI